MSADDFEERVVTVPLRDAKKAPSNERADEAMKIVRSHLAKQFGVEESVVRLDPSLNEHMWERGRSNPPSKLRVHAAMFREEEGPVIEAEPAN
ncbi:MAG: 50S ribosomal protein L31e [Halococcoides sp.]